MISPKNQMTIHFSLMLVVSVNCSDPFATFFCSFKQSVKNISDFLLNLSVQSIAQWLFPILHMFLCVWQHTNCMLTLPPTVFLPLSERHQLVSSFGVYKTMSKLGPH